MIDVFTSSGPAKTKAKTKSDLRIKKARHYKTRHHTVADRLGNEKRRGRMNGLNVLPKKVHFETQEAKEKVILLLRQHLITQLGSLILAVLMLFLPILLNWVPIIDFLPQNYRFMAVLIWYLLVVAFVYEKFISWFFHVFIITDERIIDIDFYNILYKQVSEAKIDNIEDVTYSQGGVVKAMFDYGDVAMQTAAEEKQFEIENVPQPNRVVQILNELKLEEEQEKIAGRVK